MLSTSLIQGEILPSVPRATVSPHSLDSLRLVDDPQEWVAFSRPLAQAPDCWESNMVIEGMYCAACAMTVEEAVGKIPGVVSVHVGAASRRARVVWSSSTTVPSQWMRAVQDCGYLAVPANDSFASERRKIETRQALWRWLVAGLCMMQVMMYAYPAYVALPGDLSNEMEQLLRWASWVLTLPVILFSCGPFFKSALRDIRLGQVSMDLPVALGMAITFIVSTIGTFEPQGIFGREVYFDSLTMFVFFLLTGRWLELRLRDQTAGALDALMNRLPDSVERLSSTGLFERVAARRVQVGDLLRVHAGEAFFADGVVETGDTLVDEALLTGESRPLPRVPGDQVVAGSHNLHATVLMRVLRAGDGTRFAEIVALMESAASTKPEGALLADRVAKPFLIGVLVAAAAACAWWWPSDPGHALMVAVAVLVVTCPCALSLATPAAMLASAGVLARNGVLVRKLQALDSLAAVDTVVFDKTGTITRDAFILGSVSVRTGLRVNEALALAATLAQHSLHPVSRALVSAANLDEKDRSKLFCNGATEIAGQGISGHVFQAGGTEARAIGFCRLGSADFCAVPKAYSQNLMAYMSDESGWLATFELEEDIRPDAAHAITALKNAGIEVHMLSGDGEDSVVRVAAQAGISLALGEQSPVDKLHFLRKLQSSGKTVAMVGDGLNDGPVLAGAHVAFAFGKSVPLAQSKADFVVIGDQLMRVASAVSLARSTRAVVRQNLWWALLYNAACVPLAVMGYLPAWAAGLGMAASSIVVVLNALRLTRGGFATKEV